MDFLLPVAPGGLDGRGISFVPHWPDIARSAPIELTQAGAEPLTLADAKAHLRVDANYPDDDPWITSASVAVRRQVETDLNLTLVKATLMMTFDQFPLERWLPLTRGPVISVEKISSFDIQTGAETTFDLSNYDVDLNSLPGRVTLKTGCIWPVGVKEFMGGKIAWTAGYADGGVPSRYIHAMKLLLAHWFENREAVTSGTSRYTPDSFPLGYDALLGDRQVAFG